MLKIWTKVHLVTKHLAEELALNKHGTALLNEWAGESVLTEFDKHHSAFIVNDTQSEYYPKKLLRAIQSCNANLI